MSKKIRKNYTFSEQTLNLVTELQEKFGFGSEVSVFEAALAHFYASMTKAEELPHATSSPVVTNVEDKFS